MEIWTSVLVSLASFLTLAPARLVLSGTLVAVRLRHPHRPSLPPLLHHLHHLRRHRHRRHRLLPLPTAPLPLPLLHRHRAHSPLHRLRPLRLLLLRPAAVWLHRRALTLSREHPSRREPQTTSVLIQRLGSQTFPTWLRLLSTWERWFASPASLVRKGRCILVHHWSSLAWTTGVSSCNARIPISCHSLPTLSLVYFFDFSGLSGGRFLW